MYVELVILTKSSKYKGYCVAGIDIRSGEWIRLTSNDESTHGALLKQDMKYENKTDCELLDVVKIQIIDRNPLKYQRENVLIDKRYRLKKISKLTINDVLRMHPPERHRFIFGNQWSYVTTAEIDSIGYSLVLVKVKNLYISRTINSQGKIKIKADFLYGTSQYNNMSITDPAYYSVPNGTQINEAVLVISLPDTPFRENQYYKFVAQIYKF